MDSDDDVLTMPNLEPILSMVEETMVVEVPGLKAPTKDEAKTDKTDHAEPHTEEPKAAEGPPRAYLEQEITRLQCEELRGVILTGAVLNLKSSQVRKRVIECVHKHLVNKHRVLEYLVAQRILPLAAVKEDLRLLQLDKQFVLDLIDSVLETLDNPHAKKKDHSRHSKHAR
jgi:hypothetical protein